MALHDIVVQYEDAGARGQTDGHDGHGRTLTDVVGDSGEVWRVVGGSEVPVYEAMVSLVARSSSIVSAHVPVLANRGTKHGSADGVTRGRAIGDGTCAPSR
jgi:hypothetical protein